MSMRHFSLIPAAGNSSRMGAPKLLLPLSGRPLILHTIDAWLRSRVDRIIVVIRPDDSALVTAVQPGMQPKVEIVVPKVPPPDMKASLQAALRHIEHKFSPTSNDAFLVAPADMPKLSTAIIDRLIEQHASASPSAILAPTLSGNRGHPVLFPWTLAAEVHALGPDEGLNAIVDRQQPILIPCEDLAPLSEHPFADIDTPEDFRQLSTDG